MNRCLLVCGIGIAVLSLANPSLAQQYHTYPEIESILLNAEADFPDLCRRVNLGTTVQGRTMWALCITDNVNVDEDEPEFRYVSSLHGDEVVGIELCLNLIDELTTQYGLDPQITNLVDSVEIWIVPCANPDGFVANTRTNAHGVDLNRDFPDPFTSPSNTTADREPETANIMNWCFAHSFTLAANYHCGALVVNYPFDSNESGNSVNSPTPDDAMFIIISEIYTQTNLPMWNSSSFYHGITNGADWYTVYGGLQDWSYRYVGTNEVTIEVSNSDRPPASQLPQFWSDNRESMLNYMSTCLTGIRGHVLSAADRSPLDAKVRILDRDHDVFTDPDVGDYHRMVEPGTYDLELSANGFDPQIVMDIPVGADDATRIDAELWKTEVLSPSGGAWLSPLDDNEIRWTGDPSAQFHVQWSPNATAVDAWTDDFESDALAPDYDTGGTAGWFTTSSISHAGIRSARAGDISDNQTSWLARTVSGGPLSFWYRVSSESGYDWFRFYIDNELQLQQSGTVGWTLFASTLADGIHELRWEYSKDVSVSSGSDTAWIDQLSVTQDLSEWFDVAPLTVAGATSLGWTPDDAGNDCRVRVRSYRPLEGYGPWATSGASFTVCWPGDLDGNFDLDLSADLPVLVSKLLDPETIDTADLCAGDLNRDGRLDGLDIQEFVEFAQAP